MALSIVDSDPAWPRQFEEERARLADALGSLARRIDHNGSTSVPGPKSDFIEAVIRRALQRS